MFESSNLSPCLIFSKNLNNGEYFPIFGKYFLKYWEKLIYLICNKYIKEYRCGINGRKKVNQKKVEILEEFEKSIIKFLQKDGSLNPYQIHEKSDIPYKTVKKIYDDLKDNGYIKIKALLNIKKSKESLVAFILVKCEPGPEKKSIPEIAKDINKKILQIESLFYLTGEWDIMFKLRVKDTDEYYKIINGDYWKTSGILNTRSYLAIKTYKDDPKYIFEAELD